MTAGRFVVFEGGEGAGKTTQIRRLADYLTQREADVVLTREPGGSEGAEAIRALLVTGDTNRWDGITETFLHFAARRDHLTKKILPALERGAWVLCDRFVDSTFAYQGHGMGVKFEELQQVAKICLGDFRPDLVCVLDLPIEEGLKRAQSRGGLEDRYERLGAEFHQRVRDTFLTAATNNPDRYEIINAAQDLDAVTDDLIKAVTAKGWL